MADFGQTDFRQTDFWPAFWRPSLAKPTVASVSVLVVWPTLAKTDFGQTDFGQTDFDLWCCVWCVVCGVFVCVCVGVGFTVSWCRVGVGFKVLVVFGAPGTALPGPPFPRTALPRTALPEDRPSRGPPFPRTALPEDRPTRRPPYPKTALLPPFPWTAQNFALFFTLPPQNSFFSSLSGGPFVEFWQMCTFGVLWLSCEAPAAPKPPGFHTTTKEPPPLSTLKPTPTRETPHHETVKHTHKHPRLTPHTTHHTTNQSPFGQSGFG